MKLNFITGVIDMGRLISAGLVKKNLSTDLHACIIHIKIENNGKIVKSCILFFFIKTCKSDASIKPNKWSRFIFHETQLTVLLSKNSINVTLSINTYTKVVSNCCEHAVSMWSNAFDALLWTSNTKWQIEVTFARLNRLSHVESVNRAKSNVFVT